MSIPSNLFFKLPLRNHPTKNGKWNLFLLPNSVHIHVSSKYEFLQGAERVLISLRPNCLNPRTPHLALHINALFIVKLLTIVQRYVAQARGSSRCIDY